MSEKDRPFDKEAVRKIEAAIRDIDERLGESEDPGLARDLPPQRNRGARVLIAELDGQEVLFPLFQSRITVGRAVANDIRLGATSVSRHHALIQNDIDRVRIVDWGSMNGVQVNANTISGETLHHGDKVRIGDVQLRYEVRAKRLP